jgi:NhaP-type Na+/H+ and K+/H+ antiporter
MPWFRQRVWQMGLGALLALLGAWLTYTAAAGMVVREGLMWAGMAMIAIGLLIPLITRFIEAAQEKQGERGEC